MSRKNNGRDKGKGMAISGIPLSGGLSQVDNTSVETNRFEARNAFKEDEDMADRRDFEHRDYIGDLEEENGDSDLVIASKDDEEWSDGLEDESNPTEDYSDESLYPESQPLHLDLGATAGLGEDDVADFPLKPSTMDNQNDDFTDDVEIGKPKIKKSA